MAWDQDRIDGATKTINIASEKAAEFSAAAMNARDFNQWSEMSNTGLGACQEAAAYWASIAVTARCNLVNQP